MSYHKVFLFFSFAFLFWVFIGNVLFDFFLIVIFLSFIFVFGLIFLLFVKKYHFFVCIIGIGIFLGGFYSGIYNYFIDQKIVKLQDFYGQSVVVTWEVQELYKKSKNYNSYMVQTHTLDNYTGFWVNFLLYYPKNYVLEKGQVISFSSKISQIENFSETFHYQKFLQTKNIYFQVFVNSVDFISTKELSKIQKIILNTRQNILDIVYNMYPKDEAVFLAGILIGAREDMGEELSWNFNRSGLTHLVAVSGFNITIIIIFLWFLFQFFPLLIRTILVSFCVIFFVLVVGDNVPVVRAWIMGLVWYFILVTGRKSDSLAILLFTAFLMVLYNPYTLNYDISFHLSFLAVIGLLYFQEFWKKICFFLPSTFAIKESFVLTLSAMTTTLPIMIFSFGQVSIFAPLTNMLVWGVIPFAMLFWFLSLLWDLIRYEIGFVFWFINYFVLKYVVGVANFFGSLDFSLIEIDFGWYGVYLEILYFMMLLFFIVYFKQEKNPIE